MIEQPESTTSRLRAAFAAAFPDYLHRRVADIGFGADDALEEVISAATDELAASLQRNLRTEPPLQLVRRATESVTAALRARGVAPVSRDERSVELHPDDVFDLYPATSRDLGEEVWRVHVEWGMERARRVAGMVPAPSPPEKAVDSAARSRAGSRQSAAVRPQRPTMAVFGFSPQQRRMLTDEATELGYRTLMWRNPGGLAAGMSEAPLLTLVDISHPAADGAIRDLQGAGLRCVAVGEGIDDFGQARAMALGAEEVVELDLVAERLPGLLPRLA